jgi:hypothetical protein
MSLTSVHLALPAVVIPFFALRARVRITLNRVPPESEHGLVPHDLSYLLGPSAGRLLGRGARTR